LQILKKTAGKSSLKSAFDAVTSKQKHFCLVLSVFIAFFTSPSMSIQTLADSLGLSISTVSRALNGYTDVSAKTRLRVQEAASAIGYQPDPMAHRLATGKTGAIAIVSSVRAGNYLDASFSALMSGVAEVMRQKRLSIGLPTGMMKCQNLSGF
jgi:transcriptional regulator with XRE-family HTH domain